MKRNPTANRIHTRVGKDQKFRRIVSLIMGTRLFSGVKRMRKLAKSLYPKLQRKSDES
jgi:hypothetical protein